MTESLCPLDALSLKGGQEVIHREGQIPGRDLFFQKLSQFLLVLIPGIRELDLRDLDAPDRDRPCVSIRLHSGRDPNRSKNRGSALRRD